MHAEVMRSIHAFMHHEDSRLDQSAFTGLKYHRTDGQFWRSAPLQHFDIRLLFESQHAIAHVRDLDGKLAGLTKFDICIIDLFRIDSDGWRPATCPGIACKQDRDKEQ